MASKGTPLSIGLSIDFQKLDADLSTVANKIDKVGAEATLKVGTLSGLAGAGGINTDQIAAQMGQIGVSLSRGMATGVGETNALLLGMASRINATLERLAGVSISLFTRIDAAMRFPRFDAFLARADVGLTSIWKGSTKNISALDVALAGGFGQMAQKAAKIFKVLFADLGAMIAEPIAKAVNTITPAIEKMTKDMAAAFTALPAALNRPMATALEEFLGKLRGTLDKTKQSFQVAGEVNARAFMFGMDSVTKQAAKSMIANVKDQFAIDEMVKKQQKALDVVAIRGPKKGPEGSAAGIRLNLKPEKPPAPVAPLPPSQGSRRFTKLKIEEIKPPSATAFENFFRSIRGMSKTATARMQQDFRDVKPLPPKRIEPIKARVPTPSLGKDFLDVGKQMTQAVGPAIAKITSGISAAREKFAAFSKEGYTIDQILTKIARSFGGWGIAIAAPLGTLVTLGEVVVRTGSFFIDMGVRAVRTLNRIHNLITSIGGIGDKTFKELFVSHGLFLGGMLVSIKVLRSFTLGLLNLATFGIFKRAKNDVDSLNASVKAGEPIMGKLGRTVASVGSQMVAAFGVVGLVYKVVEFFKGGVKAASDLNAETARSKVIFGDSFGPVAEQVEKNAKAFNISKGAQMELASSFGSMAQGAGVSEAKSADLANELTSLAIEATGVGISFTEASEAMKTGLSGRAISLKQLAVNIDDNTTKAYAWKTGIAAVGQELTAQQTIMARVGQITRGLSYVQGSLTAGANSAAVQFQRAGGGIAIFAEKIGELLLPAVNSATKGFNALLGGVLNMAETAGPTLQSWANDSSAVVDEFVAKTQEFGPTILANLTWAWEEAKKGPLGFVIEGTEAVINFAKAIPEAIGIAVRNAGTLWEIAKLRVGDFVNNAIAYIETIPANFGIIFPWILKNWRTLLVDLAEALKTIGGNLLENAMNLGKAIWEALKGGEFKFEWTPLLDGFKATTEKLPDLIKPAIISSQAEIDKLYAKIGQDELNRIKPKPGAEGGPNGKKPPILGEDKGKEYKLGGALEQGTKEAFSAISKGMSGRSSTTDAVKQGVAVQVDIHKSILQQTQVIKDKAFMPNIKTK